MDARTGQSTASLREGGLRQSTEAFGSISHIIYVNVDSDIEAFGKTRIFLRKVDSDPEVDFRVPVPTRTWKSEHYFNDLFIRLFFGQK